MKRTCLKTLLAALVFSLLSSTSFAIPQYINFQGYLTDASGPVNGTKAMTFVLYEGATERWRETPSSPVPVQNGVYSVRLGSVTPFPASLFTASSLQLEVIVDGVTLSPRQELTSVAFAINADTVDGVHASSFQNRVTGTCAAGSSIRVIAADGTVTCQTDGGITSESDPQVGTTGGPTLRVIGLVTIYIHREKA